MDPEYLPGQKVFVPPNTLLDTAPREVADVRASFDALRTRPERVGSWDMDRFPHPAYLFQNTGNGETRTHFQGIQRLANHPLLVVSGGDRRYSVSHLFLVESRPRSKWGPLGSNLWKDPRSPPSGDRLRRIIGLDRDRWHAGGISVLGDVIGVPLEGRGNGQVVFLDLSDPLKPRWASPDTTIDCDTVAAGAVALTRGPNGQFLCAVWRDEREGEPAGRLDFFASDRPVDPAARRTPFEHRWHSLGSWVYSRPNAEMPAKPHYQGISFVWEAGGKLFLIGTRNTQAAAPNTPGEDWADLFSVAPPTGMAVGSGTGSTVPAPVYLTSRQFRGADEFCNFAGGGGAFVSDAGALSLYGAFHFRGDGLFRMSEFWSHCCAAANWWVDLFERSNFEGHRLGIVDPDEHRIDDYKVRFAQGAAFDETIVSARFCLPVGVKYRLFVDRGCPNNAPPTKIIDLVGTGQMVEIPRLEALNAPFGRRVRSSLASS